MSRDRKWQALAAAALAIALGAGTCGLADGAREEAQRLSYAGLGTQVFLALAAYAAAVALSMRPPTRTLGLAAGRLPAPAVAALALGTLALSHGIDSLLSATGLRAESVLSEVDAALGGVRGATLLLAVLALGIAPGIGEELVFRGLVQRGLERRIGEPWAVALAALLFGSLHLELVHGAAATALGLYLGTIAWLAGSVRAAIACHVANNVVAVGVAAAGGVALPAALSVPLGLGIAALTLFGVWSRCGPPPAAVEAFAPD